MSSQYVAHGTSASMLPYSCTPTLRIALTPENLWMSLDKSIGAGGPGLRQRARTTRRAHRTRRYQLRASKVTRSVGRCRVCGGMRRSSRLRKRSANAASPVKPTDVPTVGNLVLLGTPTDDPPIFTLVRTPAMFRRRRPAPRAATQEPPTDTVDVPLSCYPRLRC